MKHGPIALLDESTPVICVATDSPVLEKVLSNVEEVRARGAQTIAIATAGDERAAEVADETIEVAAHRLDPAADRRDPAAAAARLRHRPRPRPQRRPAAQPGQDRHGRVNRPASDAPSLGCPLREAPSRPPSRCSRPAALAVAGCGGGSGGCSGTDPASVAPPKRPVFIDATVQPEGEAKANIEALAQKIAGVDDLGELIVERTRKLRRRRRRRARLRKGSRTVAGRERRASSSQDYEGDDFEGYGAAIQTTDEDAAQDFIDEQIEADDEAAEDGSYEGVDFKVEEDETTIGVFDGLVVFAEDEATFKAMVDASDGETWPVTRHYTDAVADVPERQRRRRLRRHRRPDRRIRRRDRRRNRSLPRRRRDRTRRSDRGRQPRPRLRPDRDRPQHRPQRRQPAVGRRLRAARLAAGRPRSPPSPRPISASASTKDRPDRRTEGIPGEVPPNQLKKRPEASRASTSNRSPPRSATSASSSPATAKTPSAAPWCSTTEDANASDEHGLQHRPLLRSTGTLRRSP